ncbi:MAG: hypothetical protein V8S33_15875 [Intestinibacter bartlettii]
MNRFFQLSKKRLGLNNAIGGTGFAVRMDWLINTGGFCYKSLVEDLEMSIEIFKYWRKSFMESLHKNL